MIDQTPPHWVIQHVLHHSFHLFVGPEEMIPEPFLPEGAFDAKAPGGSLSEVLILTDEGQYIAGRGRTKDQVDVLRHHTIAVHRNAGVVGVLSQHVDSRSGYTGIVEDRPATPNRYGYRADCIGSGVLLWGQSDTLAVPTLRWIIV